MLNWTTIHWRKDLLEEQVMVMVALTKVTTVEAVEPGASFVVDEDAGTASVDHPPLPATERENRQYRDLWAAE
jgi:hypothetical protein